MLTYIIIVCRQFETSFYPILLYSELKLYRDNLTKLILNKTVSYIFRFYKFNTLNHAPLLIQLILEYAMNSACMS